MSRIKFNFPGTSLQGWGRRFSKLGDNRPQCQQCPAGGLPAKASCHSCLCILKRSKDGYRGFAGCFRQKRIKRPAKVLPAAERPGHHP